MAAYDWGNDMKRLLTALLLCLVSSLALGAVNLNTATREELIALPGIGPVKAQAIIDYRNANGPFRSIEDVMKVKGIKEGEFGKIRNDVSVSGRTTVPEAVARTAPSARPTASAPVSASTRNAATTGAAATGATAPGAKAETAAQSKEQAREERAARRAAAKAAREQASETKAAKEQKASEARTTADASATTAGTSTKAARKKSKRTHAEDDRDKAASDKGAAAGAK
jgi:competence protein ComEA